MSTPIYYPPLTNAVQKTLDAALLTGVTASATFNNVTGIQNKLGLFVVDRVDGNNNLTPNKREYISFAGTSGSTVTTLVRGLAGSTDQDHAVGAIVEFVNDVVQQQAIIDGLLLTVTTAGALNKAIGSEVDTGTDDAKIVTAKAIADSHNVPSVAPSTSGNVLTSNGTDWTSAAASSSSSSYLNQQALINGNFDVWQRGTSFTGTAPYYGPDRWQEFRSAGVAGGTWSRQTASLNGSLYSIRCQRDSGNTATNTIALAHSLETVDSMKLRGKKLTLSFWAKCGANYSAASSNLEAVISSGTGTDQSQATGFTNLASIASLTAVLTTSWQKFTVTTGSVVGDTITEIGVRFDETPVGTAGANDWFEITQVQLCAGETALPFMPKSYAEEFADCQRYFSLNLPGTGKSTSTTLISVAVAVPVPLRTAVTPTLFNGTNKAVDIGIALRNITGALVAYEGGTIYGGNITANIDSTTNGVVHAVLGGCFSFNAEL